MWFFSKLLKKNNEPINVDNLPYSDLLANLESALEKFNLVQTQQIIDHALKNNILFEHVDAYGVISNMDIKTLILHKFLCENNKLFSTTRTEKDSIDCLSSPEYHMFSLLVKNNDIKLIQDIHGNTYLHHFMCNSNKRTADLIPIFGVDNFKTINNSGLNPLGVYFNNRCNSIRIMYNDFIKIDSRSTALLIDRWASIDKAWSNTADHIIYIARKYPELIIVDGNKPNSLNRIIAAQQIQDCFNGLSQMLSKAYTNSSVVKDRVQDVLLKPLEIELLNAETQPSDDAPKSKTIKL